MLRIVQFMQYFGAEPAAAAEAAHEEAAGIAALGIDPWAILAQSITFLLLFFIIKKYALSKIVDTLEKRRQTIDDGVRLGLEMEAAKAELQNEVSKILQEARADADKIIAGGHSEAGAIIKEAESAASRKVDVMLADAHAKIEKDIMAARQGLEREMRALVAEATEVIINEKLDAKKDATLIEKAFRSLGAKS